MFYSMDFPQLADKAETEEVDPREAVAAEAEPVPPPLLEAVVAAPQQDSEAEGAEAQVLMQIRETVVFAEMGLCWFVTRRLRSATLLSFVFFIQIRFVFAWRGRWSCSKRNSSHTFPSLRWSKLSRIMSSLQWH